jgi:hypothetical protein
MHLVLVWFTSCITPAAMDSQLMLALHIDLVVLHINPPSGHYRARHRGKEVVQPHLNPSQLLHHLYIITELVSGKKFHHCQ